MKLDVGCGISKRAGHVGMDIIVHPAVDITHDLTKLPWPIAENSVDAVYMSQVIEHLPDTVGTFNELHRIVKSGAVVEMSYPWYKSYGAYGDPTHAHFFSDMLVDYFMEESLGGKYLYTTKFWKLQRIRLVTYPFLNWMPPRLLKFINRHMGLDIIHGVEMFITPKK